MARTEQEIAEGFFPVRVGPKTIRLPELPYGEARAWSRASAEAFGPVFAEFERQWEPGDGLMPVELANDKAMQTIVDQLLAYDKTNALGGRAGIDSMTSSTIVALYREVYAEAHPFDRDLTEALMRMAALRVNALSAGASSTSGPSSTGTSPRPTQTGGSPPRNSTSSGTKHRNGSPTKNAPRFVARSGPASTSTSTAHD